MNEQKPSADVEAKAVEHANKVSDPEWDCWHKRYQSFKMGYSAACAEKKEIIDKIVDYLTYADERALGKLEMENEIDRLKSELASLRGQITAMNDINKIKSKELDDAKDALKKIKAHGCCIMHNDSGCPGCIAKEALGTK